MAVVRRGAFLEGGGARFGVFAERAEAVELALLDASGRERRVPMRAGEAGLHEVFVDGIGAGQRYGFRVYGAYRPEDGDRFNPAKLLADPYARAFAGKIDHRGPVRGEDPRTGGADTRDSAPFVPKSVVIDEAFDWGDDAPPRVPWRDTVLYEAHVKGLTMQCPDVPPPIRGTYAALGADAVIAHLRSLGVTTMELLPVHEALDEAPVAARGLTNYWGYNTLGFFAADQRLAADAKDPVRELKTAVRKLHAAGIEVVLDVVYNHTCEGDELGPTVAFRGLDNRAYYRLEAENAARYVNWTGCGNTLDATSPEVVRLVLDSLRYWVEEVHVDGFRFDLAPVLGRGRDGAFDPRAPLLTALLQDPVLSTVKLVAEPWDVGPEGYQLGRFPAPFREWNAAYRDGVRRLWNGHTRSLADLGYRLSGSSDCFDARRGPTASVNFVTAHDGFTLRDLVSYREKHNEANGEENRDGWSDNLSIDFGVEGESNDPAVLAARAKQVRSILATLFFSPGVPMIVAGDEMGRTQRGNNNAYVLDDPTSWLDWDLGGDARDLLAFTRALAALRAERPELRRETFFTGEIATRVSSLPPPLSGAGSVPPRPPRRDIVWLRPDGGEMTAADWTPPPEPREAPADSAPASPADPVALERAPASPPELALAVWLVAEREHLLLVNAAPSTRGFRLPRAASGWHVLVDTRAPRVPFGGVHHGGAEYEASARSFVLLEKVTSRT